MTWRANPPDFLCQKGVKLFVPFLRLKLGFMGALLNDIELERRSSDARSEATGNDQIPAVLLFMMMVAFI